MNIELYRDILKSRIIKIYNNFQKIDNPIVDNNWYTFVSYIKWLVFFGFIFGGVTLMTTNMPPLWAKLLTGCIVILSVVYALVSGIIQYLAGRRIRQWCKKYDMSFDFITHLIYKIYNEK
jgi:apolipoprotein N-acyltransferase